MTRTGIEIMGAQQIWTWLQVVREARELATTEDGEFAFFDLWYLELRAAWYGYVLADYTP